MMTEPITTVGVVPIFVNAGASIAPLIIGSLTAFFAILLKPKEMLSLFRRKPWVPVAILGGGVGIWFLGMQLFGSTAEAASAKKSADRPAGVHTDWNAFALKLIQDKENAAKKTGIKPVWDYLPDPQGGAMVLSSPAFAPTANRVFCTAQVQDIATFFGLIYCVNPNTGKKIWQTDMIDGESLRPFFSSPALTADEKWIVVGQGLHADADCSLLCFNAETGALKWKVKTPLHIESSPAIRGDIAVVGAGAIEGADHKPTSHPGYVFAVQISTGKELWRHDVNDPESSPAFADDGTVYIGSGFNGNAVVAMRSESDDELKAKNLKREVWKLPAPYPITGPVTVYEDLILVGGGNGDFVYEDPHPAGVVLAINRKDGSIKWQAKTDSAVLGKIVVSNGRVFCPVRNGQVIALNLSDGAPIWSKAVSGKSPVMAGLALTKDGQTLFAAAKDGTLALLSTADGSFADKAYPLNAPGAPGKLGLTLSTPTLAGNKVFVGSETGGLHCFEIIGGAK
jgi:outer membrane protein assembly factor BamB